MLSFQYMRIVACALPTIVVWLSGCCANSSGRGCPEIEKELHRIERDKQELIAKYMPNDCQSLCNKWWKEAQDLARGVNQEDHKDDSPCQHLCKGTLTMLQYVTDQVARLSSLKSTTTGQKKEIATLQAKITKLDNRLRDPQLRADDMEKLRNEISAFCTVVSQSNGPIRSTFRKTVEDLIESFNAVQEHSKFKKRKGQQDIYIPKLNINDCYKNPSLFGGNA